MTGDLARKRKPGFPLWFGESPARIIGQGPIAAISQSGISTLDQLKLSPLRTIHLPRNRSQYSRATD